MKVQLRSLLCIIASCFVSCLFVSCKGDVDRRYREYEKKAEAAKIVVYQADGTFYMNYLIQADGYAYGVDVRGRRIKFVGTYTIVRK